MRQLQFIALFSLLLTAGSLDAADTSQPVYWSAGKLDAITENLRRSLNDSKAGSEPLMMSGTHSALLFHREASAPEGEIHQNMGDFCVVRGGDAAVLIGGRVSEGKSPAPGEMRGTIEGGHLQKLAAGDVIYIPPNTPHQWKIADGQHLDVQMIKVRPKPGAAAPAAYLFWSGSQLADKTKKLALTLDEFRSGHEDLITGGFTTVLVHREKSASAPAEVHKHLADFQIVRRGAGIILAGGKVVNGKETSPEEVRGTTIEGGSAHSLAAGDMLYIPVDMPHQFIPAPGQEFDVLVVKVWVD
jgi:quercetin dioxygenase-like cupin family protein